MTDDQPNEPVPLTSDERQQALDKFQSLYEALGTLLARTAESLSPGAPQRAPLDLVRRQMETMSRFQPELLQDAEVLDGLVTLQKGIGGLLDLTRDSLAPDAPQREVIRFIKENLETTSGLQQRILRFPAADPPDAQS